ncbi:MAG: TIGR03086 family metal-binding protein [Actinomycetota bacterium]|nr:TIGR03086 family metal-binding protein [Actinomycetota bacterium]
MTDALARYDRALAAFGERVHAVAPADWANPTPCTGWTVRDLVNHLTVEQLWVPHLLRGGTIPELGDELDGDQLGDDPVARWDDAAKEASADFGEVGALERTVHLSYGHTPALDYCREMTFDLTVHTWDLARAIGGDEKIDDDLVRAALVFVRPRVDELAESGLFSPPLAPPDDASALEQLLTLTGRRP